MLSNSVLKEMFVELRRKFATQRRKSSDASVKVAEIAGVGPEENLTRKFKGMLRLQKNVNTGPNKILSHWTG